MELLLLLLLILVQSLPCSVSRVERHRSVLRYILNYTDRTSELVHKVASRMIRNAVFMYMIYFLGVIYHDEVNRLFETTLNFLK